MPADLVPASTKCRVSRLRHLETERLQRRFAWLSENLSRLAQEADGRKRLREVALEFHEIERELAKRFIEG